MNVASAPSLPKAMTELIDLAKSHGWKVAAFQGEDTEGSPWITVNVNGDEYTEYRITWHTRGTGTYRLFSMIARKPRRHWHDMPSLRQIRAELEAA